MLLVAGGKDVPDEPRRAAKLWLPGALPVSLPSQIVEQRPDVRAAQANLHAAGALVGVAIANRIPLFNLSGRHHQTAQAAGVVKGTYERKAEVGVVKESLPRSGDHWLGAGGQIHCRRVRLSGCIRREQIHQ
jgi:outer membrane protein TolC